MGLRPERRGGYRERGARGIRGVSRGAAGTASHRCARAFGDAEGSVISTRLRADVAGNRANLIISLALVFLNI